MKGCAALCRSARWVRLRSDHRLAPHALVSGLSPLLAWRRRRQELRSRCHLPFRALHSHAAVHGADRRILFILRVQIEFIVQESIAAQRLVLVTCRSFRLL